MKFLTTAFLLTSVFTTVLAQGTTFPKSIQPPDGHIQMITTHAQGTQIYQCLLQDRQYIWQLKGPDATLFNTQGSIVGSHFIGPKWNYRDGSVVTGRLVEKIVAPHKSAAPWLLVQSIAHNGTGLFTTVSFINRINTHAASHGKRSEGW